MDEHFRKFASHTSELAGSPWAFFVAMLLIIGWAAAGPYFGWSDSHSLFVNTITTIITFLMVFLIQNTQNRDAKAMHLKLDELLRALEGARTSMVDLEDLSDEDLRKLQNEFQRLREKNPNLFEDHVQAVEQVVQARGESFTQ
jgi:low affinity Fe/Cu permease